ncbi:PEP-utilizing enzyme [Alkalilimnicola ehrlichii]|uniref:PEP-utilizing enzyme n=1 Tax=Alkalilimnicola ehrlichii TaxID=351052 RepID=UPI0011C04C8F|nr:PEP-utilizing enzyme [Alkalilimnicola ehrlichii]
MLDRMIGYVGGRVYYSLSTFYRLHQQSPLYPKLYPFWEAMIGLPTSYAVGPMEAAPERSQWRKKLDVATAGVRFFRSFIGHPRRMHQFKAWWQGRAGQTREVLKRTDDPLVLTEEFYRLWRDAGARWGITLVNDAYIFTLYGTALKLFTRWGLDDNQALLSNLLCGGEAIESVEIFRSVLRIAEHVGADTASSDLFQRLGDAQLVDLYRKRLLEGPLLELLDTHIGRYGDRSMEELKMETPSLREDPAILFQGIRRLLGTTHASVTSDANEQALRAAAEAELDRHFGRFSVRKRILRRVVDELRRVVAHRENSRYCRSELFGLCKDIFARLGQYLADKGAIDDARDVFYLGIEEIMGYVDGTGLDERLQETVQRRREQVTEYNRQNVAESFTTRGGLRDNSLFAEAEEETGELRGLGSSMGVARGRACVVHDPGSIDRLPENTILVAKETDPGWLFLMLAARGIVVERGSMLSHTAITGRKFGIPTVVGVPHATSRIPDGAELEIDGGNGFVRLLEKEDE